MNTKKIKDGCTIDIDTIIETTHCFECPRLGETDCISKRIVDLFRMEEELYLHQLHNKDENN